MLEPITISKIANQYVGTCPADGEESDTDREIIQMLLDNEYIVENTYEDYIHYDGSRGPEIIYGKGKNYDYKW